MHLYFYIHGFYCTEVAAFFYPIFIINLRPEDDRKDRNILLKNKIKKPLLVITFTICRNNDNFKFEQIFTLETF